MTLPPLSFSLSHTRMHTLRCTHTHTPKMWVINAPAGPGSCWNRKWVLTKQLPLWPPVACSSGQGEHIHLKSCFVCILTETALKGEMGIQSCQLQYLCYQFTNKAYTDLQSLWINCIFQGLIKLSWASAWRGTNWHLQHFLKPAVDITVPAAFSCIDPMPDLWNPWWLLTLEAYWSFPRELQDSLCSQVQLPVPPGEPISSQRAGAEQMFCVWFRILKKKKKALFCLILLFLILWLLLRSW